MIRCVCAAAAILCLPLIPQAATDKLYKWVDQDGITHYSDRPSMHHPSAVLENEGLPYLSISEPQVVKPWPKRAKRKPRRRSNRHSVEPDCERYREKIREIEAKLRAGYTEPTGTRLRERKRQWTARLARECY